MGERKGHGGSRRVPSAFPISSARACSSEGFEELSTFEEQYNYPYYQKLIEHLGYQKEVRLGGTQALSSQGARQAPSPSCATRSWKRYKVHLSETKSADEFIRLYKDDFFRILDETYAEIYGTVPFTENMKKELIKSFRQIIDIRYVAMILDENEKPVCFGLCFPLHLQGAAKSRAAG